VGKAIRKALSVILAAILGAFLTTLFIVCYTPEHPYTKQLISNNYDLNQKKAIKNSVNSSVGVVYINHANESISSFSGTYFTFGKKHYILTTAHGIFGKCENIVAFHFKENVKCIKFAKFDREKDYVIFEIEKMSTRTPIKIPHTLATWKKNYNILDKTYYTGYPNRVGPTTWTGNISGFDGDYLIIQSYAWPGSSGAGVFDEKGKLIGIIVAIDVGQSEYGYQVLNNSLIVVPIWHVDFGSLVE
jgi:V8-like Glu-specific endopeptidase